MGRPAKVQCADVPIVNLVPLRKRRVSHKAYAKLLANIKAIGLIDPLCVSKEGDTYYILDGYIRYEILLELGVSTVPCLLLESKDLYTPNRQVQNLSPRQENEQLRKALKSVDEPTLAAAFGLTSLKGRLGTALSKDLEPTVLAALEAGQLPRSVAKELANVAPKRQLEIMRLMEEGGDQGRAFVRAQILRTPAGMRVKKKRVRNPWDRSAASKRNLVTKLQEVEKHHDFYSLIYRQYVGDLLKLAIYIRQLLNRPELRAHLQSKHANILALFEGLLQESEGKAAAV